MYLQRFYLPFMKFKIKEQNTFLFNTYVIHLLRLLEQLFFIISKGKSPKPSEMQHYRTLCIYRVINHLEANIFYIYINMLNYKNY